MQSNRNEGYESGLGEMEEERRELSGGLGGLVSVGVWRTGVCWSLAGWGLLEPGGAC